MSRKKTYSLELIQKTEGGYQKITYSKYKKIEVSYKRLERKATILLCYWNGKKEFVTYEEVESVSLKVYKRKKRRG